MWKTRFIFLFWLLMGAAVLLAGFLRLREDIYLLDQIKKRGVVTQGTVVNRRREVRLEEADSHYLTYTYQAKNPVSGEIKRITHEQLVSYRIFNDFVEGAKISITYLPNDVESSWVIGNEPSVLAGTLALIGGILISILIAYLLVRSFTGREAARMNVKEHQDSSKAN